MTALTCEVEFHLGDLQLSEHLPAGLLGTAWPPRAAEPAVVEWASVRPLAPLDFGESIRAPRAAARDLRRTQTAPVGVAQPLVPVAAAHGAKPKPKAKPKPEPAQTRAEPNRETAPEQSAGIVGATGLGLAPAFFAKPPEPTDKIPSCTPSQQGAMDSKTVTDLRSVSDLRRLLESTRVHNGVISNYSATRPGTAKPKGECLECGVQ